MITIDGAAGEGGGQVVRAALAYASTLRLPIAVHHIRGGRPSPGLAAQHVAGVMLVGELTGGRLDGATLRSTTLSYTPPPPAEVTPGGEGKAGASVAPAASAVTAVDAAPATAATVAAAGTAAGPHASSPLPPTTRAASTTATTRLSPTYEADAGTAGAVTLILQAALPAALVVAPCRLSLRGGTAVAFAPPVDYVTLVLSPLLRQLGVRVSLAAPVTPGYYPRGQGRATWDVAVGEPVVGGGGGEAPTAMAAAKTTAAAAARTLTAVDWGGVTTPLPPPTAVRGRAWVVGLPASVGERLVAGARAELRRLLPPHTWEQLSDWGGVTVDVEGEPVVERAGGGGRPARHRNRERGKGGRKGVHGGAGGGGAGGGGAGGGSGGGNRSCACGLTLALTHPDGRVLGASVLGERGVPAEAVGARAARVLAADVVAGAAVDTSAADQLVPFLALAAGTSTLRLGSPTAHTRTAVAVAVAAGVDASLTTVEGGVTVLRVVGKGALLNPLRAAIAGTSSAPAGRPFVTATWAQSLDGALSAARGGALTLSSDPAWALTHGLRDAHDAIVVGGGTAAADDPSLTVRRYARPEGAGSGGGHPRPVVLGGRLRGGTALLRARGAGAPPVLHYVAAGGGEEAAGDGGGDSADGGGGGGTDGPDAPDPRLVTTVVVPLAPDGNDDASAAGDGGARRRQRRRLHLPAVLADLAARGVRSVMVEGGGAVLGSFLAPPALGQPPLVDAVVVTVAPLVVGALDAPRM
ncbi:hypothetical protein MMPV_007295 [Pyropia vietnamensis]